MQNVKITKIEPLKCPSCGSFRVSKDFTGVRGWVRTAKDALYCMDCKCRIDLKTGKVKKFDDAMWYRNQKEDEKQIDRMKREAMQKGAP